MSYPRCFLEKITVWNTALLTHSLVPSKIYLDEKCERLDIDALSVSFIMFLVMMGCVEPDKSQVSVVMI